VFVDRAASLAKFVAGEEPKERRAAEEMFAPSLEAHSTRTCPFETIKEAVGTSDRVGLVEPFKGR